jgi:protein SCO1/2
MFFLVATKLHAFCLVEMLLRFQRTSARRFFGTLQTPPKTSASALNEAQNANQVGEPVSPLAGNAKINKGRPRGPNFEFTLAQAGIVFASGMAILGIVKMGDIAVQKRKAASERALVSEEYIGKPKLGGPWTLYDAKTGRPFSSEDMKGKFQLLYFGFTYCPDICPEELEKQRAVIEQVDKDFPGLVQPVFITVDPKRDTLAQTASYVREFHPRLIGLTGAPNQVKRVTRLFRVYYNEGIKTKSTDGDEDYLVDHSIIHYLMGPDNEFVDFYGKNLNIEEMTTKIKKTLKEYNHSKNSDLKTKL